MVETVTLLVDVAAAIFGLGSCRLLRGVHPHGLYNMERCGPHTHPGPFFAALNIAGQALAIACCLILASHLHNEFSYDMSQLKHERSSAW